MLVEVTFEFDSRIAFVALKSMLHETRLCAGLFVGVDEIDTRSPATTDSGLRIDPVV
jgi:hypothetical protein